MSNSANPLSKYFRVPGLQITLPTGGKFFPEGAITLSPDGTIPVLPMRAADELLMKNPDALVTGYAIEKVIESCVPAITQPLLISGPDLDVVLLAIRAATYGETMEVQVDCPKCSQPNAFNCHLPSILESTTPVPEENCVRLSEEVVVYVRPYNLRDTTELSLATFSETRRVQALEQVEGVTEEMRTRQMNESMNRLTELSTKIMSRCIVQIVTPEGPVTEPAFIDEFLSNISRDLSAKVESKLKEMNNAGIDKNIRVVCENKGCQHEWQTTVEFDPSNFFESGS